jgi:hypothetical protein
MCSQTRACHGAHGSLSSQLLHPQGLVTLQLAQCSANNLLPEGMSFEDLELALSSAIEFEDDPDDADLGNRLACTVAFLMTTVSISHYRTVAEIYYELKFHLVGGQCSLGNYNSP